MRDRKGASPKAGCPSPFFWDAGRERMWTPKERDSDGRLYTHYVFFSNVMGIKKENQRHSQKKQIHQTVNILNVLKALISSIFLLIFIMNKN